MLLEYTSKQGIKFSHPAPYIAKLARELPIRLDRLSTDSIFKALLKAAGSDPLMQESQDNVFEDTVLAIGRNATSTRSQHDTGEVVLVAIPPKDSII